jgi:hypothetical protein
MAAHIRTSCELPVAPIGWLPPPLPGNRQPDPNLAASQPEAVGLQEVIDGIILRDRRRSLFI